MFFTKLFRPSKSSVVHYCLCCKPRPPPSGTAGGCPPQMCGGHIQQPPDCRPGPVPPNPCEPSFHHGHETWKKYKYIALFVGLPLIALQAFNVFGSGHKTAEQEPCRDYEYMRIRTKRFPWGDGVKSLFHNDQVNKLPGDCEPPPLDCD